MNVRRPPFALFVLLLAAHVANAAQNRPVVAPPAAKAQPAAAAAPVRWDRLEPQVVERAAKPRTPAVPTFPAERP